MSFFVRRLQNSGLDHRLNLSQSVSISLAQCEREYFCFGFDRRSLRKSSVFSTKRPSNTIIIISIWSPSKKKRSSPPLGVSFSTFVLFFASTSTWSRNICLEKGIWKIARKYFAARFGFDSFYSKQMLIINKIRLKAFDKCSMCSFGVDAFSPFAELNSCLKLMNPRAALKQLLMTNWSLNFLSQEQCRDADSLHQLIEMKQTSRASSFILIYKQSRRKVYKWMMMIVFKFVWCFVINEEYKHERCISSRHTEG